MDDCVYSIEVIVPVGSSSGSVLQLVDPRTQQQYRATVPEGLKPGMAFTVQLQATDYIRYSAPMQQAMVDVDPYYRSEYMNCTPHAKRVIGLSFLLCLFCCVIPAAASNIR